MGSKPVAARLRRVRKLYTHPQAWGQCEAFLHAHFRGVERQDTSSTSRAAQLVAVLPAASNGDGDGDDDDEDEDSAAAIASRFAADPAVDPRGALEVVAENIEDVSGNTTRFLVLRHRAGPGTDTGEPLPTNTPSPPARRKTLIAFEIDHARPGALAAALMIFARCGLNLTSINSRPGLVRPWQYIFFVECESKAGEEEGEGDAIAVQEAMRALAEVTESCRFLGSWANQLGEQSGGQ
ncbi:prephenate dehydratase [Ascosphaera acerosa]|nr:prephenate dehydratase [Ascosphaera acerosa]